MYVDVFMDGCKTNTTSLEIWQKVERAQLGILIEKDG